MYIIVVVMSPMGVHAPPAFEAMTMVPPMRWRSASSFTSFWSRETMTMTTVRLFKTEDRTKVRMPMTRSRSRALVGLIAFVMMSKPLCASMISTMVSAPRRKKTTSETSSSVSFTSLSKTSAGRLRPVPTRAHSATPRTRAEEALLISVCSSSTITP
jgi:hypothetical protein